MPLAGVQWKPRDVAELLWNHGWTDAVNLTIMVAIVSAESLRFAGAWHYNDPADNPPGDGSTDWGMFQLNDGNKHGNTKTPEEVEAFKVIAFDPNQAVVRARALYDARHFQPWAAYGNEAYKKFLHDATLGVDNFLAKHFDLKPVPHARFMPGVV
jgi:hypothetical protein